MDKELYEKALEWLNRNYSQARKLVGDGDRKIALFFYQQCEAVIAFLGEIGVVEYEDYCELRDQHRNLFDDIFLS